MIYDWNPAWVERPALLVGNGASIAVHRDFKYDSLFGEAIKRATSPECPGVFAALETTNFETVLAALRTTSRVLGATDRGMQEKYERIYAEIRHLLMQSVRAVHLDPSRFFKHIKDHLSTEYSRYSVVFSTNYDLILYWAMAEDFGKFKDFFFQDNTFSIDDTALWGDAAKFTQVLHPHGGLHLYVDKMGQARKRRRMAQQGILDSIENPPEDEEAPLFVSEGTADDKLAAIRRSDYLSFCLRQLSGQGGSLVIFGHSLRDQDTHLLNAVKRAPLKKVFVSVFGKVDDEDLIERRYGPDRDVTFFRAETHPLGNIPPLFEPIKEDA